MPRYLAEEKPSTIIATTQLEAIQNLLVNDYYLFLNSELKIVNYSNNCIQLSERILKNACSPGKSIQELLINIDEDLSEIKLIDFLHNNISKETVSFKFQIGNEFLMLALKKIETEIESGYACLLESHPLTSDIAEIFDNMHLVANLSWFTSHKLRGPLSAMMSMMEQNSLPEFVNNEQLSTLFIQMRHQASNLDKALHTLNTLLSRKRNTTTLTPRIEEINVKNIMMLDDEVLMHMVTKRIVLDINPDITLFSFTDGKEALEFLKTFPTDLILLDLNMPHINGWEFLQLMEDRNMTTPTIIVSSSIDTNDINRSFEYTAVKGFINKPVGKEDLKRILDSSSKIKNL